jgi:hypothetical protein
MVSAPRAVFVSVILFVGVAGVQDRAYAQNPSQTASNEVTFVGSWQITWAAGDGDDYWLIFDRPGQTVRLNVDEEDISFRIPETGTWKMRFEIEDHPNDCEAICDPANIRHLRQDSSGDPNRWHLGLRTHNTESDLDLILERTPTLEVTPSNRDFGDVAVNTDKLGMVAVKNISADAVTLIAAHDCPESSPDSGKFFVEGNLPYTLQPGESKSFIVRFNPQFPGPKQCQISFTPDRTPFALFTGRGIPATNTLSVSLNATSYTAGQVMTLSATLTPLATPATVDAYVVVQLPTGQFFSVQLDGALVPGIVPIARGIVPFSYSGTLAQYQFTGAEPPGTYTWYSVLTQPGTMTFVGVLQQTTFNVP